MKESHEKKGAASPSAETRSSNASGRISLRWLLLSSLVHLVLSVALAAAASDSWLPKKLDVVWLDLDNRLGVPRTGDKAAPAPPPAKPQPLPPEGKKAAAQKPQPKKARTAAKKKPQPGPKVTPSKVALDNFVPGNAALMLLVRTDRVRRSPYAHTVRRLLEVFYDYKMLLWRSGIDPIEDLDALLIATPNPYRVTTTFLAGRFSKGQAKVKRGIERAARHGSRGIRWTRHPLGELGHVPSPPRLRQDPRKVLLRSGLVMIVDPRDIGALARPRDAKDKAKGTTLVDRLHDLDAQGGKEGRAPGLQLQALNLRRLVQMPPDLPPPLEAKVTIPATAPARVRAFLRFRSEAEAERFFASAQTRLEAAQRSMMLRLLGVGSLLGRIRMQRRARRITAHAKLSFGEVRDLLEMFRGAIPQIHVPGMAPRRPLTPLSRPGRRTRPGQKGPTSLERPPRKTYDTAQ